MILLALAVTATMFTIGYGIAWYVSEVINAVNDELMEGDY
jgi:hypothetical protein